MSITTMRDYSEKRDFHRMRVDSPVEITDAKGNQSTGKCRDLSGSGMQLQVDKFFEEGDEIMALIPPADEQFPPFEAQCKVLRCETDGDSFLLGVTIVKVKR